MLDELLGGSSCETWLEDQARRLLANDVARLQQPGGDHRAALSFLLSAGADPRRTESDPEIRDPNFDTSWFLPELKQ